MTKSLTREKVILVNVSRRLLWTFHYYYYILVLWAFICNDSRYFPLKKGMQQTFFSSFNLTSKTHSFKKYLLLIKWKVSQGGMCKISKNILHWKKKINFTLYFPLILVILDLFKVSFQVSFFTQVFSFIIIFTVFAGKYLQQKLQAFLDLIFAFQFAKRWKAKKSKHLRHHYCGHWDLHLCH